MVENKKLNIDQIIEIKVDEELLFERIEQRKIESDLVRNDDNTEVLKNRILIYKNDTMPVLEYYRNLKRLKTVDGMRSIERVSEDIKKLF